MTTEYQGELETAANALQNAKRLIAAEIASYPTPISGCDAQFNHLLSQRAMISCAQNAMENPPFIPTSRQLEPIDATS